MDKVPFFIVGCGRSGTTLLRAIIDAREDVCIPGETHFYTTYRIENAIRYHFLTRANYLKAVGAYRRWRHVGYEDVDWRHFQDLAEKMPPNRSSLLLAYLQACSEKAAATYVGEKTPGHIRSLSRIWKDFPGARVIHVMRDPRAVAASYLGHDLYASVHGRDVTRAALKWREASKVDKKVESSFNKNNYMLLKYEDLVRDPGSSVDQVFDFLGLSRDPEILSKYQSRKIAIPNVENHRNIGQALNEGSIDKWRNSLSESDVLLVERISGDAMLRYGYIPTFKDSISWMRLQFRLMVFWIRFINFGVARLFKSALR